MTSLTSHADFEKVQASRPRPSSPPSFTYTQTAHPSWTFGSGANTPTTTAATTRRHTAIDPHDAARSVSQNYKLLVSAITPRPTALLSTVSPDGQTNLAPFSYFGLVSHDPPMFVLGFACPTDRPKDSLRNLLHTREGVICVVGEAFVEAANAAGVDAPPDVSEWHISGLTPLWDCAVVRAPRVAEAVFSVEVRVESVREWQSPLSGEKTSAMVVLEGLRFWVREDALDEEAGVVDPAVLRPVGRMGGITYSRTNEGFELPRPRFDLDVGGRAGLDDIRRRRAAAERD